MKKVFALLCAILTATLVSCGYSESDLASARSQGYEDGYEAGYRAGSSATSTTKKNDWQSILDDFSGSQKNSDTKLKPLNRPESGTILLGRDHYASEITVTADSSYDYVVSLKDHNGTTFISFYVRAGDTVTVGVPRRYLYAYFASGKEWYGYGKGLMFGENTSYSKDDEGLDFTAYSYEYVLYPVNNGNFSESPSDENEFF